MGLTGSLVRISACISPAGLPKTISEVGVHFFFRLFHRKKKTGPTNEKVKKYKINYWSPTPNGEFLAK